MTENQSAQGTNWKRPAAIGYVTIFVAFFGFGGWSATAGLDSAVIAEGVVAIASNRKTVQHYEGGIIKDIRVAEGEHVEEGAVLFRLDPTQAQANLSMVENQYRMTQAQAARLDAERSQRDKIDFPQEVLESASDPLIAREIADQEQQFSERRASVTNQIEIIDSKIEQLNSEITGLEIEMRAATDQAGLIKEQLAGFESLLKKGLIQKSAVVQLRRERASLQGIIGRATAEIAKARSSIAEAALQKTQITRKFTEDANDQIVEVRQKAAELRQRSVVASDVFKRQEITAPRSGTVQNLAVFTVGAVIRAGEPLLDIIPDDENLIVQANISPLNVDNVAPGMTAEIRLPSFKLKELPPVFGTIRSVSSDRLVNEITKEPYFRALIEVANADLPDEIASHFIAGLPAEIIVPTGERTALQYFISPLEERLRTSFREE